MRAVLGPTVPLSTNDAHATKTANDALGRKPAVQCVTKQDKGKLTELWGLPPVTIVRPNLSNLERGDLLGEGGFARVYLALESDGAAKAVKVIAKEQLKSTKTKTKLFGEIKIHQAMHHPNIISFEHCFEDDGNVYMQLELCANGSLLDLLRKRRRYSEPEARYYLVQLIGACEYMHSNSVIHRDLKLGNLMLDAEMNLMVGDFGLAALVKFPGDRKKTICGTPNYIAPEILFDTTNGHSFEVDIWSIGVILYTLLVGKPPFQTKDVKNIYKKIKENNYEFPPNHDLSSSAIDLISQILNTVPDKRPTLAEILAHDFFLCGPFPPTISTSAMTSSPDYRKISVRASHRNFANVKMECGIVDVDPRLPASTSAAIASTSSDVASSSAVRNQRIKSTVLNLVGEEEEEVAVTSQQEVKMEGLEMLGAAKEVTGMEKEVREVLQPGSPISELLRSARKPLVVSPGAEPRTLLQRKLLAEARAVVSVPLPAHSSSRHTDSAAQFSNSRSATSKAAPTSSTSTAVDRLDTAPSAWMSTLSLNGAPVIVGGETDKSSLPAAKAASASRSERKKEEDKMVMGVRSDEVTAPISEPTLTRCSARELYSATFSALEAALAITSPSDLVALPVPSTVAAPRVFITCWVDYTHKYGTAYVLTDGSSGVYFNDSTTMVLAPTKKHFDFIAIRKGNVYSCRHYVLNNPPKELERKVYLLKYFDGYQHDTLWRETEFTWVDGERERNMEFLIKLYRMRHAIMFKLSNDVLQFNFFDHTKMLLAQHGNVVTFIDPNSNSRTFSLHSLFAEAAQLGHYRSSTTTIVPTSSREADAASARRRDLEKIRFIIAKVEYCRDVVLNLVSRRTVTTGTSATSNLGLDPLTTASYTASV